MIGALLLAATVAAAPVVTVRVDTAHRIQSIRPLHALGAGIDSDPQGKIDILYGRANTRAMLAAGLGSLSYRLYTELSIQDWHWNPVGSWSDPAHARGYWKGSPSAAGARIHDSYGYRLPHRGSSRDQGDDDDYSRLDDGDPTTFWKSDPYLTSAYTHETDAAHPQWVVIDLGRPRPVDALRVRFADPYATDYVVQYWSGGDAILDQASGTWRTFAHGAVNDARGGDATRRLAPDPVHARFYRLLMSRSSQTCDAHGSADRRNCMGYAIAELGFGTLDRRGAFSDWVVHARCGGNPQRPSPCGRRQTIAFVSSTDPWHAASDRTSGGQDQTGLDVIAQHPITRGLPVMYPVSMLYGTPDDAVAEMRYLRARRYPVDYVELGEEPDGQYVTPEDDAALYDQWARALHAFDPSLRLGGPVFEGVNRDVAVWRDARGDSSWLHRFLRYLKRHRALGELAFMSFEHYPFAGCDRGDVLRRHLLREPEVLRHIARVWRRDGVPASVPLFITEGNYAADGGSVPQRLDGALWWADYIGTAFASGIARVYHYQYEAEPLGRNDACGAYGNYGMFITDARFRIRARAAQYYAAWMLARRWLAFGDQPHDVYPATSTLGTRNPVLTAYAVRRPDRSWSLLLVNKDGIAHRVQPAFADARGRTRHFFRTLATTTFGQAQYAWSGRSAAELPRPADAPLERVVVSGSIVVPAHSLVVARGQIER